MRSLVANRSGSTRWTKCPCPSTPRSARPCDLPLAEDVTYTENGVRVALGDGLWKSASGRGAYRVYLANPTAGQAGYYGDLDENGRFALVAARLQLSDGLVSEIEVVIARPERANEWGQLNQATHSMFIAPLLADVNTQAFTGAAPEPRAAPAAAPSVTDLLAAIEQYYQGLRQRDGSMVAFTPDCHRLENGVAASSNPNGPVVDARHPEFGVFAARLVEQLDLGYIASLACTRRRPLVVDTQAGLVLDLALFDYSGAVRSVAIREVGEVAAAASFAAPCTDIHAQLFWIEAGRIAASSRPCGGFLTGLPRHGMRR